MEGRSEAGRGRGDGGANAFFAVLDWPLLWGLAATCLFYASLRYLPDGYRAAADRYVAGHWVQYAETGVFFVGLALLAGRGRRLNLERKAVAFAEAAAAAARPSAALPAALYETLPPAFRETAVADRLRETAEHLESPAAGGLGDLLRRLSDLAAERLHAAYAAQRTLCRAILVLGGLGTVIGLALAVAEIDPQQFGRSWAEVAGGLAVAFDATALALVLSLTLAFATLATERADQALLARVEAFGRKRLAPLEPAAASPLVAAETQAAAQLVERTDAMIRTQTEAWQGAIESMRRRWADTLVKQQDQLRDSLSAGIEMTLTDHAAGLKAAREELVSAVQHCTDRLDRTLTHSAQERARQLEAFSGDLRSLWDRCRGDLDDMQERYRETLAEAVSAVGQDFRTWSDELRRSAEVSQAQRSETARQTELLVRVSEQSAELSHLEGRLSENLQSLRVTETIQEAVHSLTAATHLLTARTTLRRAA